MFYLLLRERKDEDTLMGLITLIIAASMADVIFWFVWGFVSVGFIVMTSFIVLLVLLVIDEILEEKRDNEIPTMK